MKTNKKTEAKRDLDSIKRRIIILVEQAYLRGGIDTLQGTDVLKEEK